MRAYFKGYREYSLVCAQHLIQQGWTPVLWSIANHSTIRPEIERAYPETVIHDYAESIRGKTDFGWSPAELLPLDAKLLDDFAQYESICLRMMDRNELVDSFSYNDRIRHYHRLIRLWNTALQRFKIEVVVFQDTPHQVVDFIIYILCKRLKIKTFMFNRSFFGDRIFAVEDYKEGPVAIRNAYSTALENDRHVDLNLSQQVEGYINRINGNYENAKPFQPYDKSIETDGLLQRALKAPGKVLSGKVLQRARQALEAARADSGENYYVKNDVSFPNATYSRGEIDQARKKVFEQKQAVQSIYESMAVDSIEADTPYIFCALHQQPELSTSPLGDQYANQLLMIEALSKAVPEGWLIYVKDHYTQFSYNLNGESTRNKDYYQQILDLGNTRIASLKLNSFQLIDRAMAGATVTGLVAWESVMRGKPGINFGHSPLYMDCHGIFRVYDFEEVQQAVDTIAAGFKPDKRKVHLYAQVVHENTVLGGMGSPQSLEQFGITNEINGKNQAEAILNLMNQS
jgi:hypothetical protein